MDLNNQSILITGGTSGIGLALARELVKRNNKIVLLGRNRVRLDEISKENPNFLIYQADVGDYSSLLELPIWVEKNIPNLNILINSAGTMTAYNLLDDEKQDINLLIRDIQTNLLGTININSLLLPTLKNQKESMIVNISSGLANISSAAHPTYSASKAGVHMFTSALRDQLSTAKINNLHIMELVPPLVSQTNLEHTTSSSSIGDMRLEDLVKVTLKGMEKNKIRVNAGFSKVIRKMGQIAPDLAESNMAKQSLKDYFPDDFK